MIKALIDLAKELKLDYNKMDLDWPSPRGFEGVYFCGPTSISPFSLGAVAARDHECSVEQFIGHMREAAKSAKLPFTVSSGYSCRYNRTTDSISIYTTNGVVTLDADDITNLYNVVS